MAEGAHRAPGGEESLRALYDAVPSAEELDLAEGAGVDAPLDVSLDTDAHSDEAELEGGVPEDPPEDEITPLSDGQARGVLEQLLGAEPVEDEPDES